MRNLKAVTALSVLMSFAVVPAAMAGVISINNGDFSASQFYLSQTYGEIKDNNFNNLTDAGKIENSSNPIGASTQSFTLNSSGSTMTSTAYAAQDGFGRVRASASATISNASSSLGYTTIGSYGMRTQAQFSSAQTPGQVVFNFAVSGTSSIAYGLGVMRLDFLADSSSSGSFFDVFGGSALHATGPGTFSFTYTGSTASPLDILFYAAAGVLIGSPDYPDAADGATFTDFVDFSHTFDLTSIDLFTADGTAITDWTMTDLATNQVVFNQNGRIEAAVPGPAGLGLLALGAAGLGVFARRRRIA